MSGFANYYKNQIAQTTTQELETFETDINEEVNFPIDAFPGMLRETVMQVSKILQVAPSHVGTGMLSVAGYAIGNTLRTQLSDNYDPVPCTTWTMLIEASGRGKGKANSFTLRPIKKRQKEADIEYSNLKLEQKRIIADLKKEMSDCDKEAKAAFRNRIEYEENKEIEEKKYITTDVTIESIRHNCRMNPRGVFIMREELAGWYNSFGKYAKGNSDDESAYIEIYDGEDIRPSRSNGANSIVINPFVPVHGGTQPKRLSDLAKNNRMVSGFVFRMMFSYPPATPLSKMDATDILNPNNSLKMYDEYWDKTVDRIFELPMNYMDSAGTIPEPQPVKFDEKAVHAYVDWINRNRSFANNCNFESYIKADIDSIVSRLEMNMLRICLIMQTMKWSTDQGTINEITEDTVIRCGKLMDYYRFTSLKVYTEIEKLRFELGLTKSRKVIIDYKPLFNNIAVLSKWDLIEKVSKKYKLSKFTAEKYVNDDVKSVLPPIDIQKDGRKVYYGLVDK